jgi:hypothetical protein
MNRWIRGLTTSSIVVCASWLTTSLAAAQPSAPTGSLPAPPPPAAEPAPAPLPPPPVGRPAAEPADPSRPTELAFGIGVGYTFPTSLQTPNTTSVRLRLASGLTFEPQLVLATSSSNADPGNGGMTTTNKQSELTVGSLVRYPLRVHSKVDLEALGRAAISSQTTDPNGDNNNRTVTTLSAGYGVGLAYWITRHWNLSLTATNPLIAYTRTRQEMAATATTTKTTTIGLIFDPTVALMIHLYD